MRSARSGYVPRLRNTLLRVALAAFLVLSVGSASAQQDAARRPMLEPIDEDPPPTAPAAPSLGFEDEDLAADWRDYALEVRDRVIFARMRLDEAVETYRRGRHKRKMRGEDRREALAEREAARAALAEAEAEWAALPDRARAAGVPAGWIRDAVDG